jgi:hypothetical protein
MKLDINKFRESKFLMMTNQIQNRLRNTAANALARIPTIYGITAANAWKEPAPIIYNSNNNCHVFLNFNKN